MRRLATIALVVILIAGAAALSYRAGERRFPPATPATSGAADRDGSAAIDGPYFSDSDQIAGRIVAAIHGSRSEIDVAMYDLTEPEIAGALEAAARRGVRVRVVADRQQARERHSELPDLRARGIPVRLSGGYRGNQSLMHDKFAVFDSSLAVTGSFNWTTSAAEFNFENALFVRDPNAVARYQQAFDRIWAQGEAP